jgi:xylose dehydrogenase (NAD/NADP)
MSSQNITWGVLGTANIGRVAVIPAIQAAGRSTLLGVASRTPERAGSFADEVGIPRSYGSYAELLADDDISAVYIPLPNALHREWAINAARAGKHVLCEKPLAMDAAQCLEMDQAGKAAGVKMMEAFMYRFHPRTERVIEMVQSGSLGAVSTVESSFTFRLRHAENIRFSHALGGGALMDVGCYCVNVSRTMVGEEPSSVSAVAVPAPSGVEGRLTGFMSFPSGTTAHFDCSLLDERRERYLVAGEDGYVEVENAFLPGETDCDICEVRGRNNRTVHTVSGVNEYQLMVEHFTDCILNDSEPRYGVQEAAANMRAITALLASARSGGEPVVLRAERGKAL